MSNTYSYRRATVAEAVALQELTLRAYGKYETVLGPAAWQQMQSGLSRSELYQELLERATCFVCEKNNRLVGMVFLVPSGKASALFAAEWASIRLLGVDPEHSGRGIAQVLMRLCLGAAQRQGECWLALHTGLYQQPAARLYEQLGFRFHRELEPIFGQAYRLYLTEIFPPPALSYHRAGTEDIETLIDLRLRFSCELLGNQPAEAVEQLKSELRRYLLNALPHKRCVWYIARAGGQAAGTGCLVLREQPGGFLVPNGRVGYLFNMYTLPDYRGRGICSEVLRLLTAEAATLDITAFELHATRAGEPVYLRQGFVLHPEPTYRKYTT